MKFRPPGDCPNCGEEVTARARACRHCGATAEAGWNAPSGHEGLDLPDDDDFDYAAFTEKEFGIRNPKRPRSRKLWPWVALILAGAMVWFAWGWVFQQ